MQPYPRSPDLVWPGHLHGTGCLSARAVGTGFPTVVRRLSLGPVRGWVWVSLTPPVLAGVLGGCVWARFVVLSLCWLFFFFFFSFFFATPRRSWLGFAAAGGGRSPPLLAGVRWRRWCVVCGVWCVVVVRWWGCGWCVVSLVPRHSWRRFLCATPRHSWLGFAAGGGGRSPPLLAGVRWRRWCVVCGVWCVAVVCWWGPGWCVVWLVPRHSWRGFLCATPRHSWLGFAAGGVGRSPPLLAGVRWRRWCVVCGLWCVVCGVWRWCVGGVVAGVWCGWSLATPGGGSCVLLPATPGWVSLPVVVGGPRHSWLGSAGGGGVWCVVCGVWCVAVVCWWGCGWCVVWLVPGHSWRRFPCATSRHSWLGFAAGGGGRSPPLLAGVRWRRWCVVCGVWCVAVVCWWSCGWCVVWLVPRHSRRRFLCATPRHSWLGFTAGVAGRSPPLLAGVRWRRWCVVCGVWCVAPVCWWGCGWCVVWLVSRHSWRRFLCATPRHSWLGFAAGGGGRSPPLLAGVRWRRWCVVCGAGVLVGLWLVCGVVGPSPLLAEVPVCYSPPLLAGFRCRWWWAVPATPGWGPLAAVVCGVWCVVCGGGVLVGLWLVCGVVGPSPCVFVPWCTSPWSWCVCFCVLRFLSLPLGALCHVLCFAVFPGLRCRVALLRVVSPGVVLLCAVLFCCAGWCRCSSCHALWCSPLPWGLVLCGAPVCGVPPRCSCFVVAC